MSADDPVLDVLDALDAFIGTLDDMSRNQDIDLQKYIRSSGASGTTPREIWAKPSSSSSSSLFFDKGKFPKGASLAQAPLAPAIENIDIFSASRETRWHLDHGERVPRDICAGCRRPIALGDEVLDLADDNWVHFKDGYECLIRHGQRWRRAAQEVIAHFDNGPWGAIGDLPTARALPTKPARPEPSNRSADQNRARVRMLNRLADK
jgi:hypothetical protein